MRWAVFTYKNVGNAGRCLHSINNMIIVAGLNFNYLCWLLNAQGYSVDINFVAYDDRQGEKVIIASEI